MNHLLLEKIDIILTSEFNISSNFFDKVRRFGCSNIK